jgi:hypothetical protein
MPRCLLPRCLIQFKQAFVLRHSAFVEANPEPSHAAERLPECRTTNAECLAQSPSPPPVPNPQSLPLSVPLRALRGETCFSLPQSLSLASVHSCAQTSRPTHFPSCLHPNTRQTSGMSTATPPLTPLPSLTPDDNELLFLWFTSDDALAAICSDHKMTLRQIAAWAKRPDIAETIATLRELHEERAKLQLTLAAHDAILTLKFITTTEHPTNANEIARRAAEGILTRCHHLRPEGSRVVVKPPPAPTPPAPPPPPPQPKQSVEPAPQGPTSPIPSLAHSPSPSTINLQPQSPRPEAINPTFPRPAPTPIPATHPAVPTLLHGFKRSNWCRHLTRGIPNHFKRCTPGHALRPLPNRPPPHWRRPQRPLLLGLRQSQWRPLHDPHRRHRPGPLQR